MIRLKVTSFKLLVLAECMKFCSLDLIRDLFVYATISKNTKTFSTEYAVIEEVAILKYIRVFLML